MKRLLHWLIARLLDRRGAVVRDGRVLFTMRDYSRTTSMRLRRFFSKEPDTIRWIDAFEPGSVLLDIGANVGSYSLYAGCLGHRVLAVEPDALNFALLNLNIQDNQLNERITAYPYAIHDRNGVAQLNMSAFSWGGAHNSFDRALDWRGQPLQVVFRQGSAGITVDEFLAQTDAAANYLKIDVDGNELCVLRGARHTLANVQLRGVLVELTEGHAEYAECIDILGAAGFVLGTRTPTTRKSPARGEMVSENHIFHRPRA